MRGPISGPIRCAMTVAVLLNLAAAAMGQSAGGSAANAAGVRASEPWYTATRVADKVWRIDDHGNDNLYLVEGTKQAMLVDTGLGAAKLGDFVKTLTTLPLVVVNTHGHGDHAGGNNFFPEVYAHPAEFEAIQGMNEPEGRRSGAERLAKSTPGAEILSPEEAGRLAAAPAKLLPLKDGQVFDLGGRTLEVIEQPGHTPGEIVLLDKGNRLLFGGDNDNALVWLWMRNSRPLDEYLASLKRLRQRAADYDTILPGHGSPLPASHVGDQIACVEDILGGRCTGEPYERSAGVARVCAHGPASVAFDPKNLRAPTLFLSSTADAARITRVEASLPPIELGGTIRTFDVKGWMDVYNVPGLSVAVFDDFHLVWAPASQVVAAFWQVDREDPTAIKVVLDVQQA